MITFPYAVKYNGVIYPANTPIKETKAKAEKAVSNKKDTKKVTKGDD